MYELNHALHCSHVISVFDILALISFWSVYWLVITDMEDAGRVRACGWGSVGAIWRFTFLNNDRCGYIH